MGHGDAAGAYPDFRLQTRRFVMRSVKQLAPWVFSVVALALVGCASDNTRVSTLEQANTRLTNEKNKLTIELAAAQEKLAGARAQAQKWEATCTAMQTGLSQFIMQSTQEQIRQQIVTQAITQAQNELANAPVNQATTTPPSKQVQGIHVDRKTANPRHK
jgi:hypothetical protein